MYQIFENIFLGIIGGLTAYWVAHRRFISQRWWDKRFDLYGESFEILKQIEHSFAIFEWAVENDKTKNDSEAIQNALTEYEEGLSRLHGIQYKMLLVSLEDAHHKLLILSAALKAFHPRYLSKSTQEDSQQVLDLIKQTKRLVGGCSGELAFQGRENLKMESIWVTKSKKQVKAWIDKFKSRNKKKG